MHHLLHYAPPSRVATPGPDNQILIPELAPHTYNFDPFCCVCLNQECISHGDRLAFSSTPSRAENKVTHSSTIYKSGNGMVGGGNYPLGSRRLK